MSHIGRIAVFLPNWIGDVVMATPSLRALREHFSGSEIIFVGRPGALEVLAGAGFSDAQIACPPGAGALRRFFSVVRRLRQRRADLAVLLPNSFRTALLARLGRCRQRAGYARDGRSWLLTDRLSPLRDENGAFRVYPALEYYADLVESLGATVRSREMSLATTPQGERQAEQALAGAGFEAARPLVMLNPGGAFGPSKMWDADRYAVVADELVETHQAQIVVNAAPAERAVAAEVAGQMRNAPLIDFADQPNSLSLLKSLLRRCNLLITNDTGARHVAAAMGSAVVTLFGSTDPGWTTINYARERIVRVEVPCSPCQKKVCLNPPGDAFHQCMKAITPEMVLSAARELLDAPAGVAGDCR